MSCEGVLVRQKHGGPHGIPHESRLNVNIDLNDEFRAKNEGLTTIQSAEDSQIIQDGVGIDEKNVVEDNLHFCRLTMIWTVMRELWLKIMPNG